MILRHTTLLIDVGGFSETEIFQTLMEEMKAAILAVTWPTRAKTFKLYPEKDGNGVVPIKCHCLKHLQEAGWLVEHRVQITAKEKPGPVDAVKLLPNDQMFAFEWETGNISSSHRALNKMTIGMLDKKLVGGALVLPSRAMYEFLTDRVGNYQELVPYFPVWQNVNVTNGVLVIFEIEHDALSETVPKIPKGTDGNAFRNLLKK